jgi:hypothetical protein
MIEGGRGILLSSNTEVGGVHNCFVLVTQGPFDERMLLVDARVEVWNANGFAHADKWATEKAKALGEDPAHEDTCAQGIDVWIGQ